MSREPIDFDELLRQLSGQSSGEGGDPPPAGASGEPPPRRGPRRWLLIPAGLVLAWILLRALVGVVTDWWWFASLDQEAVYQLRLLAPIGLFAVVFAVALAWLAGNAWLALREAGEEQVFAGQQIPAAGDPRFRRLVWLGLVLAALLIAFGAAPGWRTVALWRLGPAFGQAEPIFGKDFGYYVWTLPFLDLLLGLAWTLLLFALAASAAVYALGGSLQVERNRLQLARPARAHLLGLASLGALLWAAGQWLARYDVLYTYRPEGPFFGAGYTDVVIGVPAQTALAVAGVIAALAIAGTIRSERLVPAVSAIAALFLLQMVLAGLLPSLVQRFRVDPDELTREAPYIENNIELTRHAFGLDEVTEVPYDPDGELSVGLIEENEATISSIRLWDWRALRSTFKQLQEIRQYYEFLDVDVDRYALEDGTRQVLLSARELQTEDLANQTWVNLHLQFTHGYGAVVTPVDEVDRQGLPVLWSRDIPPVTVAPFDLEITEPRLYFGEAAQQPYVIVGTRNGEFDYPSGDGNVTTVYQGADGVGVGSLWRRALFALRFGDLEILFSDEVLDESRILLRRNIRERLSALAPFLAFDPDPYLVIGEDGRLFWIADAYTVTGRFPYAEPVDGIASDGRDTNYARNSVKVLIDAYEGTTTLYVVDPEDPVIRAWRQLYPGLLRPVDEMPAAMQAHWRYPEALFRVQSRVFQRYHMRTAEEFYNAEDLWVIPTEKYDEGASRVVEPYYVTLQLRGEEEAEFLLMRPYTPRDRQNLTAWLAARSDPGVYGELVVYRFPKGQQYYGTQQIETRIDQDTEISEQLTLWDQGGSGVLRGNLLVIPIGDALLYVEPLYLRAADREEALPELKRVIVADNERVVMGLTLRDALTALLAPDGRNIGVGVEEIGDDSAEEGLSLEDLIDRAQQLRDDATESLQDRDWTGFGRAMDRLDAILSDLAEEAGVAPTPTPLPTTDDGGADATDGDADEDAAGDAP